MARFYVIMLAILCVASGCHKTPIDNPLFDTEEEVRFSVVSATVKENTSTRAKTDENLDFTNESQIGIYATKGEENDARFALTQNANVGYGNPTGSTQWSVIAPAEPIRFFKDNQPMNFFSYHPFTGQEETTVALSPTEVSPKLIYTLPENQSSANVLTVADLMWGKKNDVTSGTVNLEFEHKLSKLSFKINCDYGWGSEVVELSKIEVVGTKMFDQAKLDISTGNLVTQDAAQGAVYCNYEKFLLLDTRNSQECQFIVIPTDVTDLEVKVTVVGSVIGEKVYSAQLKNVALPAGHLRQLTMTVYKENSLYVMLSAEIQPWEVINDINMEGV